MHARLVLFAIVITAASCGKPTLKSLCVDAVKVSCDKLFECSPGQTSQLGFSSTSDCATKLEAQAQCAAYDTVTCDGVDLQNYQRCVDDMRGLACPATSQPDSCKSLGTPTCTSSDGKVLCMGGSGSSGTGCSQERSSCNDGHTYAQACENGTCTCSVDGVASKTYSGSSCPTSSADLNTACGWNLR